MYSALVMGVEEAKVGARIFPFMIPQVGRRQGTQQQNQYNILHSHYIYPK